MKENPKAKAIILQGVKEQLNSPESLYVKHAYDRLIGEGHSEEEVTKMPGCVLAVEMWEMNVQKRDFNEPAYIERLEKLRDMSWLNEGE